MIWDTLLFTASVTLPVCVMLIMGVLLKRWQFIDEHFVTTASHLVFNFCMPALIFTSILKLDVHQSIDFRWIVFVVLLSFVAFISARVLAQRFCESRSDFGVFIQGGARSNLAIVGMALAGNLYGHHGIALTSLAMAFLVPFYNVASIFVLSYYACRSSGVGFSWKKLIKDLMTNPLILAIVVGFACVFSGFQLPVAMEKVAGYFSQITLPLALISIGGSLSLDALKKTSRSSIWAAVHKVVLMPVLITALADYLGFKGVGLGVVFLVFACPTAAASFVMTRAVGGNSALAANIIVLTTLSSLVVTSVGIFVLKMFGAI